MTSFSAQISLYPLGRTDLSPVIEKAVSILSSYGLEVIPGSMSTLIRGDVATVFSALQNVFEQAASENRMVMVTTFSNACPVPTNRVPENSFLDN